MTEQNSPNVNIADPDEIDLRELFAAIWAERSIIVGMIIVFALASSIYAITLPNIYKSDVILAPATETSGLKVPSQLGGLAALAGVNLGGDGGGKTTLALEIMRSREFLGQFIIKNDLYIPIMAAKGWDRANDKLIIDADIYNESTKDWVRDVEEPFKPKPSVLETIEEFDKMFTVIQDKDSGMVTLAVQHYSPYLAKKIADKLVVAINEDMRQRELIEAQRSIAYLNEQIGQTNLADARSMLFSLIEEQTKTVMLANAREEYVFKTVDPAIVAEKKMRPNRVLIVVVSIVLAIFIGCLTAIIRLYREKLS